MPKKIKKKSIGQALGMALKGKLPSQYHSPQGKLHSEIGGKKLLEVYVRARKRKKLSKRIAALVEKTSHDKGLSSVYSGSTSRLLSSTEWHKREDRSVSQSSLRAYRSYKRNFGGK